MATLRNAMVQEVLATLRNAMVQEVLS